MKSLAERKRFLKENSICYKCCVSSDHMAKDCRMTIHCSECNSQDHVSVLHDGPAPWFEKRSTAPTEAQGGERKETTTTVTTSVCTEICGIGLKGKSCSKICLVNFYPDSHPEDKKRMYVMLDDQSNLSLARSAFFRMFNVQGEVSPYTMRTCSGTVDTSGRRAKDFVVESLDGKVSMMLPTLIECNSIPDNRQEIPTPEAAAYHPHLQAISSQIPPLDPAADILIIIGRNLIRAHKVRKQRNGPHNAPYAQLLDLGWVIVGDVCFGGAHKPMVSTFKTSVLENGRPSFLTPCKNSISSKERFTSEDPRLFIRSTKRSHDIGKHIFKQTKDDNMLALSGENEAFLDIMDNEFTKNAANSWVAPLPFRCPREHLPNNRDQAVSRLLSLRHTLEKKADMKDHYVEFMETMFKKGHAEIAPPLGDNKECWYLPSFGIYHPQRPGKIRIVFDSSAQ